MLLAITGFIIIFLLMSQEQDKGAHLFRVLRKFAKFILFLLAVAVMVLGSSSASEGWYSIVLFVVGAGSMFWLGWPLAMANRKRGLEKRAARRAARNSK